VSARSLAKLGPAIAASLLVAVGAPAASSAASGSLALGIQDPLAFQGQLNSQQRALALKHAHDAGATVVRLGVSWRYVNTTKPQTRAEARDPKWGGYRWDEVDGNVRAVRDAGMQPLLVVVSAPDWFEGPQRPGFDVAPQGTWRPQPSALGDFARAIASRYGGNTSDSSGARLPRVRYFQVWNEPNLTEYLAPQARGGSAYGTTIYRALVNAFYANAKAVHSNNFVVAAGLAPFGDYPPLTGGGRTPPLYFARKLLCVNDSYTRASHCPRLRFDAFAGHAFPEADPRENPLNPDDTRLRMTGFVRALRLAARAGTITSRQAGQVWMTELGWNGGTGGETFSYDQQALFMQLGFYMLWAEGVDNILWYNIRDRLDVEFTFRSGLYTHGDVVELDEPKPALTAFRFPFVALTASGRRLLWGRAPSSGRVTLEQENGSGWRRVASFQEGAGRVFTRSVSSSGPGRYRARQGSLTSLPFAVTTAKP
jgi:hypothetical protein